MNLVTMGVNDETSFESLDFNQKDSSIAIGGYSKDASINGNNPGQKMPIILLYDQVNGLQKWGAYIPESSYEFVSAIRFLLGKETQSMAFSLSKDYDTPLLIGVINPSTMATINFFRVLKDSSPLAGLIQNQGMIYELQGNLYIIFTSTSNFKFGMMKVKPSASTVSMVWARLSSQAGTKGIVLGHDELDDMMSFYAGGVIESGTDRYAFVGSYQHSATNQSLYSFQLSGGQQNQEIKQIKMYSSSTQNFLSVCSDNNLDTTYFGKFDLSLDSKTLSNPQFQQQILLALNQIQ
eukprot:403341899